MGRLPRRNQWSEEACYHLMNRGHDRDAIFLDDEDRAAFVDLVVRYRQRYGLLLHHYCLMGNHFHLVVRLAEPGQVSPLMAGLRRAYVHHCHRRHGFVGHRWQGRFKSPAIQCRTYLLSCGRYFERNPLAAGLVAEPWAYRWSSAAAYALGQADGLVDPSAEYLGLASESTAREQYWRAFLTGVNPNEEAVRREDWAIGDDDFRRRLAVYQGRPAPRPRGRPPMPAAAETLNASAKG